MKVGSYKEGSRFQSKSGDWCTVVEYIGAKKVGVVFDNFSDIYWTRNEYLRSGDFVNPSSKTSDVKGRMFIGQRFYSESFGVCFVKSFLKNDKVEVEFNDGTVISSERCNVFNRRIRNPNKPSVHGVGYIGQGKYDSKDVAYTAWTGMLSRCYSSGHRNKTYSETTVDSNWLSFQNFAKDYHEMLLDCKFERPQLDKDLLTPNSRGKLYSKSTCCLIPHQINTALQISQPIDKQSDLPCGVSISNATGKYKVQLSRYDKNYCVGEFSNLEVAVNSYNVAKSEYIRELANNYRNQLKHEVYTALITKSGEILNAKYN